ncbi:N-acetyl-gamma-glutamyl-phosphate reductase [Lichenicoccus sp.]|uniref:N-acetyl-gamma-glutamyl-phosphate reductase n=1 Tax=Lichenicoccus sp. TaxID=2781899 RepID=UPI003D1525FC
MTASIFIDGEAGTTGLGIRTRLQDLPVTVRSIAPDRRRDPEARLALMREVDLVVLCLPDDAARESAGLVASLGADAPRLLDASTAFRTAPDWVYGFEELAAGQAEAIASAPRVSNPGCYATGAIALLRPLVDGGLIPADLPLSINAVSGYSGGGRSMIAAHEATGGPAFLMYGLGLAHKHLPEITTHARLRTPPVFVPSVGHFAQGMIVSIPLHLAQLGGPSATDLLDCLQAHYAGCDAVSVVQAAPDLTAETLAGSDRMELSVHAGTSGAHALLTARLDNLGKGASGAALQNIRLMLGLRSAR